MIREHVMSAAAMPFKSRVERFLVERHGLGFSARSEAWTLRSFARHLHEIGHCGPLTVKVMTEWERRNSHGNADPVTWARRLKKLRTFVRRLQQFEPNTEVPDDTIFGRMPERGSPAMPWKLAIISSVVRPLSNVGAGGEAGTDDGAVEGDGCARASDAETVMEFLKWWWR
jgi:hypothetical protein